MKRFIISIVCVTVFFIGVASIIEETGARISRDEKAMEIINKAKAAIGGEANIAKVESMSIVAKTTHFFEGDARSKQGGLEINFALPDRYAKMVRIGDPKKGKGDGMTKEVNVIRIKGDSDESEIEVNVDGKDKENVFFIKKGEGEEVEDIKITDDKIIIKKKDGTTKEVNKDSDNVKKIVIEDSSESNTWKSDDGKKIKVKKRSGDGGKWTTKDGKEIEVMKDRVFGSGGTRQNEMLRTTFALLLTPPKGMDVEYKFLGEGNVDGSKTNIVGIKFKESSFSVHFDASSNLPRLVSFKGRPHRVMVFREKGKSTEKITKLKKKIKNAKEVEHLIKFSDFKTVAGLRLPHTWTETAGGKKSHTVSVTSFAVNPPDIEDKFKNKMVFVKKN
ncbi:MAG: hypothetical protein HKN25_06775 [Pyrinomonadaceae bacterium]|nr:hypothetical protein [Pyrinomonadaceae bacterium]